MSDQCKTCKHKTISLTDPCRRNKKAKYMHTVFNIDGIPVLAESVMMSESSSKITKCDKWEEIE